MEKFSKTEAIKFGWNIAKSNIWFFVKVLLIIFFINFLSNYITEKFKTDSLISFVIAVISIILGIIISIGIVKISLNFCYNQKSELSDLFVHYRFFFKYLLSTILYTLIVLVGTILFVIPGIILGIKFQFYPYFIVDKGSGPIEALKRSSQITKGVKWHLFIFNLMLAGVGFLGILAFIIGLFWTIPTTWIAHAFVYRKLLNQLESQSSETTTPETKIQSNNS